MVTDKDIRELEHATATRPNLDGAVLASRRNLVRVELHAPDAPVVAGQSPHDLAHSAADRPARPHQHLAVGAARHNLVGVKLEGQDGRLVRQIKHNLARSHPPELHMITR